MFFLLQDDDKLELDMKSDLNSDVWNLIPNVEDHHRHLQQLLDHVLDQRVAMTDMKYRHIVSKLIVVILSLSLHKTSPKIFVFYSSKILLSKRFFVIIYEFCTVFVFCI